MFGGIVGGNGSEIHTLNNKGTIIGGATGAGGLAISGDQNATDVIYNSGTIRGDVDLISRKPGATGDANTFNNQAGGVFNSGSIVKLGAAEFKQHQLNNSGTISPGGDGTIRTTNVQGDFFQGVGGILKVDANWATGKSALFASYVGV